MVGYLESVSKLADYTIERRERAPSRGTTAVFSAANDLGMLSEQARRPEHEALDQGQALVPVAG